MLISYQVFLRRFCRYVMYQEKEKGKEQLMGEWRRKKRGGWKGMGLNLPCKHLKLLMDSIKAHCHRWLSLKASSHGTYLTAWGNCSAEMRQSFNIKRTRSLIWGNKFQVHRTAYLRNSCQSRYSAMKKERAVGFMWPYLN